MRTHSILLVLMLTACDGGLGRPVVGIRPSPDAGENQPCDLAPDCVPVRTVEPSAFSVPAERRVPPTHIDCDDDGFDDASDNCPGVPNEEQDPLACAAAQTACDDLKNGATNLEGADLRGCRWEGEVLPGFTLRGANLRCANLTLKPTEELTEGLDLSSTDLTNASLSITSESALVVDLSHSQVSGAFVETSGGVRLRIEEAELAHATIVLAPGGTSHDPAPALELRASKLESCVIHETPGPWPGQVRVERSTVDRTAFDVVALDVVVGAFLGSTLGAEELFLLDVGIQSSAVSTGYGAISMARLRDVIFARCEDLQFRGGLLREVDVALCEPDRLRIDSSSILQSRFAGGLFSEPVG